MAAITGAAIAAVGVGIAAKGAMDAKKASSKANAIAESAADRQANIADRQQELAEKDRSRWESTFQPLEDELVNESKSLGTIANQNKEATNAAADVAANFASARERLKTVPGANPSQQATLQEVNRINLAEAATSASAQTKARQSARDKSRAALQDASAIGRGMVSNASSQLAAAGSGLGAAARFSAGRADASGQSSAEGWGAAGRIVGGLTQSKPFQTWMNGGGTMDAAQAGFSQTSLGSSGFGTGAAYGGQDYAAFI